MREENQRKKKTLHFGAWTARRYKDRVVREKFIEISLKGGGGTKKRYSPAHNTKKKGGGRDGEGSRKTFQKAPTQRKAWGGGRGKKT